MPLQINDWLSIPDELLDIQFSRAGGPGGQNVNKVSSRVEIFLKLSDWTALPPYARTKLEELEHRRISREGVLRITCQLHRDQTRNREAGLEKLKELILTSLERQAYRHATRPSRSARASRLKEKRVRGQIKGNRGKVSHDSD